MLAAIQGTQANYGAGGVAGKTVQTFAGHSSLQVTMDRYGHLFKSDDHSAAMDRIATNLYEVK